MRMSEVFKNVPVVWVPMETTGGEIVILDVVANNADNPGNSVFGPKGVICPGNIITSMLVKSMIELVGNLDYDVIGVPRFVTKGFIGCVENKDEIRIMTKRLISRKLLLEWEVDDNEND